MKNIILIIIILLSSTLFGQTKKDTLTVDRFTVDKNGKTILKYNWLDGGSVTYKIEGKTATDKWVLLNEGGAASVVAVYTGFINNSVDTFTLKLNSIKVVRLQIKFEKSKPIIKTATIP